MNLWRSTLYGVASAVIALTTASCGGFGANPSPSASNAIPTGYASQPLAKSYKFVSFSPSLPYPWSSLMQASTGQLYGTTFGGSSCQSCELDGGVYRFASGKIETIYQFKGSPDGANPEAGLTEGAKGVLYGATVYGGKACGSLTCGTVYELVPSGSKFTENVIYRFKGGADGASPVGGLYIDKTGALYGMTTYGGSTACPSGCGIAYRITGSGKHFHETVIYSFKGAPDGANPRGTFVADGSGALYGTTYSGGAGACGSSTCGTIIKLTPSGSGYTESVIHNFKGAPSDGANPRSKLLPAGKGIFYGAALKGGADNYGTVYELACSKKTCKEKTIHSFLGTDGAYPRDDGGLVADASGNLYGTTDQVASGYGTLFSVNPSTGNQTTLHKFAGSPSDGATPHAGPLLINGYLYGAAFIGGSGACTLSSLVGCGTVYIQKI